MCNVTEVKTLTMYVPLVKCAFLSSLSPPFQPLLSVANLSNPDTRQQLRFSLPSIFDRKVGYVLQRKTISQD